MMIYFGYILTLMMMMMLLILRLYTDDVVDVYISVAILIPQLLY